MLRIPPFQPSLFYWILFGAGKGHWELFLASEFGRTRSIPEEGMGVGECLQVWSRGGISYGLGHATSKSSGMRVWPGSRDPLSHLHPELL